MVSALTLSTIVLSSLAVVRANPVPSAPGPGDVFQSGKPCTIEWSADTTGQWKNMAIELMTGDNWSMVHLTTVTTIDATTQTSYSWTCPAVTPNAPIYFYQFSAAGQNLTWTTRWTIASENGDKVAAPNQTQPDGQNIPWGIGALVDQASATPPPPWLASSPSSSAGSSSASAAGSSAPVSSASVTGSSAAAPSSSAASTPKGSSSSSSNPRPSGTGSSNSTVATSGNNSTNAASAALGRADVMPVVARGATALAAVAAVFAAAL